MFECSPQVSSSKKANATSIGKKYEQNETKTSLNPTGAL